MSTELDAELLKIAKRRLVGEYLEALGSTPEQAKTAAAGYADQFAYSGAVLSFKGELAGTPAMEAKVRDWFAENKLDFLIGTPTMNNGTPNANAELVEAARAGNMTARGKLFVQVGKDQAKLDAILSRKPFNAPDDTGTNVDEAAKQNGGKNPWSGDGWNITEQGRLLRANPKLAASLAASAKSKIGATRPTRAAFEGQRT
jgi:hypothetical protein